MVEIINKGQFFTIHAAIEQMKADHIGEYTTPYWGDKMTPHIKNRGLVIGYKDTARSQSFRVDFDPHKKLHINWEQDIREGKRGKTRHKECYKITPHVMRPDDMMFDWWRRMTLHHCTELPEDIREKLDVKGIWLGGFWV